MDRNQDPTNKTERRHGEHGTGEDAATHFVRKGN